MAQNCVDCHFFIKEARGLASVPITLEVHPPERELSRKGDYSWVSEQYALACHFGVWDEGHNFDASQRLDVIARIDRRNFCFFWKYRPGMLLPAAKILQEREAELREAARDRRLAIWGLWIAALALAVDVFLRLVKY